MRLNIRSGIAIFLFIGNVYGADLYLIANPNVQLSSGDVREVFLGDKQFAGSVKLTPVDNIAAQALFLSKLMRMDATKYNSLWLKKSFRDGLNPPPTRTNDAQIVEYVKRTPGAVGYVTAPPAAVTVVQKL